MTKYRVIKGVRYRVVEIEGVTINRQAKKSRQAIVIHNTTTSLSSARTLSGRVVDGVQLKGSTVKDPIVPRSSGSLKGVIDKAKSRTPFSVAHVPGQPLKEHRNVTRVGPSKFVSKGKGRFKNG